MSPTNISVETVSQSEQETYELGRKLGASIQPSTVIGLTGTLGTGKTRLTQGLVAGVMEKDHTVVSPTFTLCIPYSGRIGLWHLDAYRLRDDDDVFELGLDEAVEDGNALVIEWVEKVREQAPPLDLEVELIHESETSRRIQFRSNSILGRQLLESLGFGN